MSRSAEGACGGAEHAGRRPLAIRMRQCGWVTAITIALAGCASADPTFAVPRSIPTFTEPGSAPQPGEATLTFESIHDRLYGGTTETYLVDLEWHVRGRQAERDCLADAGFPERATPFLTAVVEGKRAAVGQQWSALSTGALPGVARPSEELLAEQRRISVAEAWQRESGRRQDPAAGPQVQESCGGKIPKDPTNTADIALARTECSALAERISAHPQVQAALGGYSACMKQQGQRLQAPDQLLAEVDVWRGQARSILAEVGSTGARWKAQVASLDALLDSDLTCRKPARQVAEQLFAAEAESFVRAHPQAWEQLGQRWQALRAEGPQLLSELERLSRETSA